MNRRHLLESAKQDALGMSRAGYLPPRRRQFRLPGRGAYATFDMALGSMRDGHFISDHDLKIALKVAHVMTGGDTTSRNLVDEQTLLDLEREAFLSLCGEEKTQARIMHMLETGKPHMWLDARHLGGQFWERRFPTILATCRHHGVDPVTGLIPVAPAQHYASGGVVTDLWGRTTVRGLYATGEVACSGVHGANRLASNSLLEGLVFSRRIAEVLPDELLPADPPAPETRWPGAVDARARRDMQQVMTDHVGVLRSADGMAEALSALQEASRREGRIETASWETTNLFSIAQALTLSAQLREETRGSHWREDFPERDDATFAGHVDVRLLDGALQATFQPSPATDGDAS